MRNEYSIVEICWATKISFNGMIDTSTNIIRPVNFEQAIISLQKAVVVAIQIHARSYVRGTEKRKL